MAPEVVGWALVLLALGLLTVASLWTRPLMAAGHRRYAPSEARAARRLTSPPVTVPSQAVRLPQAAPPVRLLFEDYERLLVTRVPDGGTVVVSRPPGQDPDTILWVARLVLAEHEYQVLADHLRPASAGQRRGVART